MIEDHAGEFLGRRYGAHLEGELVETGELFAEFLSGFTAGEGIGIVIPGFGAPGDDLVGLFSAVIACFDLGRAICARTGQTLLEVGDREFERELIGADTDFLAAVQGEVTINGATVDEGSVTAFEVADEPACIDVEDFSVVAAAHVIKNEDAVAGTASDCRDLGGVKLIHLSPGLTVTDEQKGFVIRGLAGIRCRRAG